MFQYNCMYKTGQSALLTQTKESNRKELLYFAVYNVHPHFWTKLSGKKSFHFNFLIQLFIYIQILAFCIIKDFYHLISNILWYKKFCVTNNYKTQEPIKVFQVLPMYNVQPYFSLKNMGKKCALYAANYSNPAG